LQLSDRAGLGWDLDQDYISKYSISKRSTSL
jgi:hypothetical protein